MLIKGIIKMKILIFDDNKQDIQNLKICIQALFNELALSFHILECQNKDEVIMNIKNADLLFLDIELKNENGINIGYEIQSIPNDCRIILTTNYAKYAIEGYKIHADRYFIKPISQQEFNIEMTAIIKKYLKKYLGFYNPKISKNKIYYREIMYIEFFDRKTIIHLVNGTNISTSYPLKYWFEQLHEHGFHYPHKSFLVNLEYISAFKTHDIILINEELIPLSRHFKNEFESIYNNYLHEVF